MNIRTHPAREARKRRLAVIAVGVWMLWNVGAQSLTGALMTSVTDTHKGGVPAAVVRISSTALIGGSVAITTNDKGQVRFPVLPPGTYARLQAHASGSPDRNPGGPAWIDRDTQCSTQRMRQQPRKVSSAIRWQPSAPRVTRTSGCRVSSSIPAA